MISRSAVPAFFLALILGFSSSGEVQARGKLTGPADSTARTVGAGGSDWTVDPMPVHTFFIRGTDPRSTVNQLLYYARSEDINFFAASLDFRISPFPFLQFRLSVPYLTYQEQRELTLTGINQVSEVNFGNISIQVLGRVLSRKLKGGVRLALAPFLDLTFITTSDDVASRARLVFDPGFSFGVYYSRLSLVLNMTLFNTVGKGMDLGFLTWSLFAGAAIVKPLSIQLALQMAHAVYGEGQPLMMSLMTGLRISPIPGRLYMDLGLRVPLNEDGRAHYTGGGTIAFIFNMSYNFMGLGTN